MPPELTFQSNPDMRPGTGPASLDLAGAKRPRCALRVPPARTPGVYLVNCPCGAHAAFTVSGTPDDPATGWLACWQDEQPGPRPSSGPPPGATLFSARRSR
jgi:hypothetical protein